MHWNVCNFFFCNGQRFNIRVNINILNRYLFISGIYTSYLRTKFSELFFQRQRWKKLCVLFVILICVKHIFYCIYERKKLWSLKFGIFLVGKFSMTPLNKVSLASALGINMLIVYWYTSSLLHIHKNMN